MGAGAPAIRVITTSSKGPAHNSAVSSGHGHCPSPSFLPLLLYMPACLSLPTLCPEPPFPHPELLLSFLCALVFVI